MERASSAAAVQKKKKGRNDNNDNTGAKWHEKRVEENYGFSICPFFISHEFNLEWSGGGFSHPVVNFRRPHPPKAISLKIN